MSAEGDTCAHTHVVSIWISYSCQLVSIADPLHHRCAAAFSDLKLTQEPATVTVSVFRVCVSELFNDILKVLALA